MKIADMDVDYILLLIVCKIFYAVDIWCSCYCSSPVHQLFSWVGT